MGQMYELSHKGDTTITWDSANSTETAIAKKAFNEFIEKGYSVFRVKEDGSRSKRLEKFDPEAERLVAVPRIVGG